MREIVLQTKKLTKSYGRSTALDHADMAVYKGDIYGLIGRNGAGKTTMMKVVSGLTAPTNGEYSLFGKTGLAAENEKRRIGCLIENPAFFGNMTAYQNLRYYCYQKGIADRRQIDEVLDLVKLSDARNKKFKTFSLGMKQRLGIAFAVLDNPDIVILDEPINGLDPIGISELRDTFRRLSHERGMTLIISSHILSELYAVASRFLFIDSGHMPFGRSGKTQVADMLLKVARTFPEYRVVIKPRWLRGAVQQHFAHKNTEHLYDVIEARCQGEVPPNLVMLSEHRELGALVSESDVVLSLYSTAILNAMLQDKPVLILTGWDCEDKWDLRSKTTIRNMKEFFSTSGCAVDIGEVCDYLPKGLKTCERFMQEVMPYRDPAAGRIVDTMEYVHSAFLQNGVFPAPGTVRFETLKADLNPDPQRTFEQLKRERIREIMQQKLYKVSCKVTAQVDFGAYYRLLEERCPCCELTEAGFEKLGAELNRQKNECLIANGDALNGDGIDQSFYFDACFQQGMEEKILSFPQEKVRCEAVYDYYAGLIYENREERPEAVRRYVRFLTWSTARSFCKYRQEEAYNTCRPFHVIFYDYDGKNVDLQTFASLYCGFFEKKNDTYVDPAVIRWAGEKLMAHLDELKKENPELALRAAGYFYSRGGDELMEERAKQLREQQERIAALEAELAALKGSRSYKLGRMLTALPRRAKRLVRQKEK